MNDMEKDSDYIECNTHGKSHSACICGHLAWNPVQRWHGNPPAEDDQWPDAWCAKCEEAFLAAGEWNDENMDAANITVYCSQCYENARAKSIDSLHGDALRAWQDFLDQCWSELQEKQDKLSTEYRFGEHERYDWNQETAELVFSNAGVPAVIATIQFIGSISTTSNTWLWSWSNFHLLENVRREMDRVRVFGEEHGFPRLTVAKWNAVESDGWEMSAVAVHVLKALGVYRSPRETGFTYMAITSIRPAQETGKSTDFDSQVMHGTGHAPGSPGPSGHLA